MKAFQPKPDAWYEVMVRLTGKDQTLCESCVHHHVCDDDSACNWGFYPITSDGQDCPYRNKEIFTN